MRRRAGQDAWYEYHCSESPKSSDAALWYRSHQKVKILKRLPPAGVIGGGEIPMHRIRFLDGHEGDAFDDELLTSPSEYERPDPPPMPKKFRRPNPNLSQLGYLPSAGLRAFWAEFQDGTKDYRDWARGGDGRREDRAVWIDIENDFDRPFVWLRNIGSYARGQGKASSALRWLCDLADRYGVELRLEASPLVASQEEVRSGKALSLWHLKRWYKRHGFKPIPGRGGAYMRRTPAS